MVSERDRILKKVEFLQACGVTVNIGKNKAKGNKGFFSAQGQNFRIDISKDLSETQILKTLAHEFAHFVHYQYDKSLKSLDFVFDKYEDILEEELISLTVEQIPKSSVRPLFEQIDSTEKNIARLLQIYPQFNDKNFIKTMEEDISKTRYKFLLKYDRIKCIENFKMKIYSVDMLNEKNLEEGFIILNSQKRKLRRLKSKAQRLNRYYSSPTELFARAFELYVADADLMKTKSNYLYEKLNSVILSNKIPLLTSYFET